MTMQAMNLSQQQTQQEQQKKEEEKKKKKKKEEEEEEEKYQRRRSERRSRERSRSSSPRPSSSKSDRHKPHKKPSTNRKSDSEVILSTIVESIFSFSFLAKRTPPLRNCSSSNFIFWTHSQNQKKIQINKSFTPSEIRRHISRR